MNIYFLVEGRSTEKKIYPKWLAHLVPELKQVKFYNQVKTNNYYLVSGQGYPNILNDGLQNAVDKIQETPNYDYLVLSVDVDEDTIQERLDYIKETTKDTIKSLGNTQLKIILQNRCIETWLLGNRQMFDSRQPQEQPLSDYVQYYDVSQNDPELMGDYNTGNHADFHFKYLKKVFTAKNTAYNKKFPRDAQDKHYLEELIKRTQDSQDLNTFRDFLSFCETIRNQIA